MQLSTREVGEVKVVDVEGSVDTNTSPDLEVHLNGLIDQGASKILLNFEKLEYLSSAGLRVLLGKTKQMKAAGGAFGICVLNDTVQEIFDISGFSAILNIYADENEAVESL